MPEVEGLYKNDLFYLLITGEGKEEAQAKLAYTLGLLQDKISEVINLGLCGALTKDLKINSLHFIRTIYAENDGDMVFKSFSTQDQGLDIVTSNKRVLNHDYANFLENFAPLVDRELWAIAHVCKLFHKPLRAIKLISDYADGSEICKIVKDKQEELSDLLFEGAEALILEKEAKTKKAEFYPEGIHLSISMQRKYTSLLNSLLIKYDCSFLQLSEKLEITQLQKLDIFPKKKGHILLERMTHLLSPYRSKLETKIQNHFEPLSQNNITVKPDKDLDSAKIQISFTADSKEELDSKLQSLKKLDFNDYKKIIFGENDVF